MADNRRQQDLVDQALPLRPRDFFVLVVLAGGDRHGYGIMKAVEAESKGSVKLEVGSLYRTLDRLLDAGLIEEAGTAAAADPDAASAAERRRNYRLTPFGRHVARAEAARLRDVVRLARAKGLLEGTGEAP
jgi:DNA-binding PadR family transcriptional regulator